MKAPQLAFKLMGDFPPFLEKPGEEEFFSSYQHQVQEYCRFCISAINAGPIEYLTKIKGTDRSLRDAVFIFWWILNKNDPAGKMGYDLWPSFYMIAKSWIVPPLPKGTGSKSHQERQNIHAKLKRLQKQTTALFDQVRKEGEFQKDIVEEIMRANGALTCALAKVGALVEQSRTSFYYERQGADEIIRSLGDRKHALAMMGYLYKILPKYKLKLQKNAKNWNARLCKMKARAPVPPSTEPTLDDAERLLDAMDEMGLGQYLHPSSHDRKA
jgi:hypothetical protein